MIDIRNIKVGDRITFRAATRYDYRKATRVVTHEWDPFFSPRVGVSYNGWKGFWVHPDEIIEHHPKEVKE